MICGDISRKRFAVTLLSCVVILIPPGGITYGFNSITPYLLSYMKHVNPESKTTKADFGKVYAALLIGHAVSMILGGLLERKFSTRLLAFFSVITFNVSICCIYWTCSDVTLLIINYLFVGFSLGIVYISSIMVSLSLVDEKHNGLISGLACFGYGLSSVFISPLQTLFINPNNKDPIYDESYKEYIFTDEKVISNTPKIYMLYAVLSSLIQIPLSSRLIKNNKTPPENYKSVMDIFYIREFYILFIIFALIKTPLAFIASYAKFYGETFLDDDMFLSVICGSAALFNSLGRPFWGFVYDKLKVNKSLFLLCFGVGLSIICFYSSKFITVPWIAKSVYSVSMWSTFFCVVGSYAVMPAATAYFFGETDIGIKYGVLFLGQAFGAVLSVIYSAYIPFWTPIMVTVMSSAFIAGLFSLMLRSADKLKSYQKIYCIQQYQLLDKDDEVFNSDDLELSQLNETMI